MAHTPEGYQSLFNGLLNVPNASPEWQKTKGKRSKEQLAGLRDDVRRNIGNGEFTHAQISAALRAAAAVRDTLADPAVGELKNECTRLIREIMDLLPAPLPLPDSSAPAHADSSASWKNA